MPSTAKAKPWTPEPQPNLSATEFSGRFSLTSSIDSITIEGIPESAGASERAERLRAAYEDVLKGEIQQVLDELNERLSAPQSFLNDKDRQRFGAAEAGTVLEFEKSLNYVWNGEKKTVDLLVRATLGSVILYPLDAPAAVIRFED